MQASDQFILEQDQESVPLAKWQKTINLMAKLFRAPASFIVQYTPQGYQVVIASEQQENPYPVGDIIPPTTNIFCKKVVECDRPLYVNNATELKEWETNPEVKDDGFNSYLGFPIKWPDGKPFGTICVMDYEKTSYNEDYVELVEQFRGLIQDDLIILDNYQKMQEVAMLDPLTHINNRRAFMLLARERFKLARRIELTLGILFVDVDDFKTLNDKYGHEVGDKVLSSIAESIKANLRDSDITGRIGGDEFVAIAQVNEYQDLLKITGKIKNYHRQRVEREGLPRNSFSVGCVLADALTANERTLAELIDLADQAMYQVKATRKA